MYQALAFTAPVRAKSVGKFSTLVCFKTTVFIICFENFSSKVLLILSYRGFLRLFLHEMSSFKWIISQRIRLLLHAICFIFFMYHSIYVKKRQIVFSKVNIWKQLSLLKILTSENIFRGNEGRGQGGWWRHCNKILLWI